MADLQSIRLADVTRFVIGEITITPAARTLAGPAGERVLEPRVMQVLITLHRQLGDVVGRDTLVDTCWDGRVIGEDAVNRAILKLRRSLDEVGGNLVIETIAKVGYRLCVRKTGSADLGSSPSVSGRRGRWLWAGTGVIAGVAAVTWIITGSHERHEPARIIAIQPLRAASQDMVAQRLSQDFTSDLSRAALGHDGRLEFTEGQGDARLTPAFTVRGSVASIGKDLHAVVVVSDRNDPAILWSHDYTAPIDDAAGLREQVSINEAAVLVCAVGTRGVPDRIDARATAMYLETCNLHAGDHRREAYLLRQVVARAPLFADAWASLAISLTLASWDAAPAEAASMRLEATGAAQRARQLDPHCGNAFYAQALLLPGIRNWLPRERIIRAGLDAESDDPQLYNHLGHDLAAIGRGQDSIVANRRAVALDPLFPGKARSLAQALDDAGDLAGASTVVKHMEETWPDNDYTWYARFETAARLGDADQAAAMLDGRHKVPLSADEIAVWRVFLNARRSPAVHAIDQAVAALLSAQRRGTVSNAMIIEDLAQLGQPDIALQLALRLPLQEDSAFWFRSSLAALRTNPSFITVARRQGLVRLWRVTGQWPDFCANPSLSYDCRKTAVLR